MEQNEEGESGLNKDIRLITKCGRESPASVDLVLDERVLNILNFFFCLLGMSVSFKPCVDDMKLPYICYVLSFSVLLK